MRLYQRSEHAPGCSGIGSDPGPRDPALSIAKPLANGDTALLLLNRRGTPPTEPGVLEGSAGMNVSVMFDEL